MQKVTLYKIDNNDNIREWSIWVDQNQDGSATIQVEAGIQGGAMVPSSTPITEGKNIGRSTETTPYQQAVLEAQAEIELKLKKRGYARDVNNMNKKGTHSSGIPQAMLANKYHPTGKQNKSKTLDQLKIRGKKVYLQHKIDGNRCLAHVTLNGTTLHTRSGIMFPVQVKHVADALTEAFKRIYKYVNEKYGVTEYWVDGELWHPTESFNSMNGILKKKSVDMFEQVKIDGLEYHIYDVVLDAPYETRHKVTQYFNHGPLKRVMYDEVLADEKIIDEFFLAYLKEGHEGLMIRKVDMPYQTKRTDQLLKYKSFEDDEFEIVGFEESRKKNTLGAIVFQQLTHPDGPLVQTFKAAPTGMNAQEQKEMWDNQGKWLGKKMTVEYFGFSPITEGGRPRFPKAKGQRVEDSVED